MQAKERWRAHAGRQAAAEAPCWGGAARTLPAMHAPAKQRWPFFGLPANGILC